jgi:hypothetical protein
MAEYQMTRPFAIRIQSLLSIKVEVSWDKTSDSRKSPKHVLREHEFLRSGYWHGV